MFDPASTTHAAIFTCSPRAGGNSDRAAELIAQGVANAGGASQQIILRQFDITPCQGCHRCKYATDKHCYLAQKDNSGQLFQTLHSAPVVFFTSPIYYYHLPAGFKNFIDRGQSFYLRMTNNDEDLLTLPKRKAHVALIAGRPRGDNLFTGSLLTLKYFLMPFQFTLAAPLLLPGMDEPADLKKNKDAQQSIIQYAQQAWEQNKPAE